VTVGGTWRARARAALLGGLVSGPKATGLSLGVAAHHGSSGPDAGHEWSLSRSPWRATCYRVT
jgi:hypothetical protein